MATEETNNAGTTENNSTNTENNNQQQNNAGGGDPLASFWEAPKDDKKGDEPKGEENSALTTALQTALSGVSFGEIFDSKAIEELADGKTDGLNANFAAAIKKGMETNLEMTGQIFQHFGEKLIQHVESLIESKLTGSKSEEVLLSEIPAARDPKTKPLVEKIFKQAMTLNQNDTKKAVEMTKEMIKTFVSATGEYVPVEEANAPAKTTDWIAGLMSKAKA